MEDTYDAQPPAPPAHADADAAGDEPEPKRWPDPDPNTNAESFGTGVENATEEPRIYREGDEVDVFYRALEDDTGGYFPCADSTCLLYTSPSPRDMRRSRMPSSA